DDQQEALHLARQALRPVHELGHMGSVRFCLDLLGVLAGAQGHFERAGRLFGAAETVHETTHASIPNYPALYSQHGRLVTAMRSEPNAARFLAAWAHGRALSLDAAVAYAMADEEPAVFDTLPARPSTAAAGAGPLTRREWEVAAGVARGLTNRQIAVELV